MPLVKFLLLAGTFSILLSGCGRDRKIANPEIAEGEKFLEENARRPGVVTVEKGVQYEIISPGSEPKLRPEDFIKGHFERLDFQGNPILDGTSRVFFQDVGTFWDNTVSRLATLIGEGGRIRIFLAWNRKGENLVAPGWLSRDATVVWELYVERIVPRDQAIGFVKNTYLYPFAQMVIFDAGGKGEPDTLSGGKWKLDADRFDPLTSPLTEQSLRPAGLFGSAARSVRGGGEKAARWEWVGPGSGIFVRQGITRAEDDRVSEYIYGSNTGGQDWTNPYEALSYLDIDKDGWVSGNEMVDVHVWIDSNVNGKPEDGEVKRAGESIRRINVRPRRLSMVDWSREGDGVIMNDGSARSSWGYGSRGVDKLGEGALPDFAIRALKKYGAWPKDE